MGKKKLIILLAVVLVISGAVLAYFLNHNRKSSTQKPATQPATLRVVYVNVANPVKFLFDFPKDKGYFARENLNVEAQAVSKNSDKILISGNADVQIGNVYSMLLPYLENNQTIWLATAYRDFTDRVGVSNYPKEESSQIKKVGVSNLGSISQLLNELALQKLGVDPNSVEYVSITSDAAKEQELASKQLDFAIIDSKKTLSDAGHSDKYTLYNTYNMFADQPLYISLNTTKDALSKKPKEIANYVEAMYLALNYAKGHKAEVVDYVKNKYGLTDTAAQAFYTSLVDTRNAAPFVPSVNQLSGILEMAKKIGKPTNPNRNLSDFINSADAQAAVNNKL